MTFVFHLQNCNYFSMYVFLPFWSLLQLSRVYSSLHRAGGRWDNSGSCVSHVLCGWVSPRLRQKTFLCPQGQDRRVMRIYTSSTARQGSPFRGRCRTCSWSAAIPALYLHTNRQNRRRGKGLTSSGHTTRICLLAPVQLFP